MPGRPLLRIVLATSIVAALLGPVPAQGPGKTTRRDRHWALQCNFKDDLFAEDAMQVLAEVWKLAESHFPPTQKMKAKKFKVFVYGERARYEAMAIKYKKPAMKKFQGFADGRTRSCHILRVDARWWTRPEMDPSNRHVIAHAAMHLVVMAFSAHRGLFLPKWVSEGVPIWAEGEVMQSGGWAESRTADVDEGTKLRLIKKMLGDGRFPKVIDILDNQWGKLSEFEIYYPVRILWTYLDEVHGDKLMPCSRFSVRPGPRRRCPRSFGTVS